MRHPVYRTACALALVLLVPLAGCATASTQPEASSSRAPATSASPEAEAQDATPGSFPPAPADVSGMRVWFEQAFPKAAWLARIKSIEYVSGEVPESGGFANAVVITTDLDFKTEQPVAQEIVTALGEAHPTWAKQYVVRYADGNNIQAGDIFDMTP